MKIGYAKLGRSIPLRYFKSSSLGGDQAVVRLFDLLRAKHEVHVVGPNQGVDDAKTYGYVPENTVNHWADGEAFGNVPTVGDKNRHPNDPRYNAFLYELKRGIHRLPKLDSMVIWLGQHSSVSSFLPPERDKHLEHVTPLMSQINYVYPLLMMLNELKIKPIWLHPDARNILKSRDLQLTGQRTILSQYNRMHTIKSWHPTEGTRDSTIRYKYSGIDMLVVPPESIDQGTFDRHMSEPPEQAFGACVNEGLDKKHGSRLENVLKWCKPMDKVSGWELIGHWKPASQWELGRKVTPVPNVKVVETMKRWRSTITFPPTADSYANAWVGAKQWECFIAGVLCFRPGKLVDIQGHAYGSMMPQELRDFLTVHSPAQLVDRVTLVATHDEVWRKFAKLQFDYVVSRMRAWNFGLRGVEEAVMEMSREQASESGSAG